MQGILRKYYLKKIDYERVTFRVILCCIYILYYIVVYDYYNYVCFVKGEKCTCFVQEPNRKKYMGLVDI